MSHFTVMVIGEDVESILAPYDENIQTEPHIDKTKEEIYKEFIECYGETVARNTPASELKDFDKLTLSLDSPNKKWIKEWCGQDVDKDGNTLTMYNEDSKWDWYQVGGRWTGSLVIKSGESGELGEPSWTNKDVSVPLNRADVAHKFQIDWDAMNKAEKVRCAKTWDELFNPNPDNCWFRPEYVKSQQGVHLKLYGTKEEYVKRRGIWTPYAVVTADGWFAPGEMGFWGMSSDETEDREQFEQMFKELIAKIDDNELITMVDCHI